MKKWKGKAAKKISAAIGACWKKQKTEFTNAVRKFVGYGSSAATGLFFPAKLKSLTKVFLTAQTARKNLTFSNGPALASVRFRFLTFL